MAATALDGIRVVELGTMVSGPYCGKLLADLGAEVIKVEAPAGDPARNYGLSGALFLYNNTSKSSLCLDLDLESDPEKFRAVLSWADALIDNQPPAYLEARGLGPEELQALYPKLVYTSITPYGRWGAQSSVPGDELTLTQAGGLGNLLPSRSVDVDRAPAMLGGCQVGYHGAIVAALATAGALLGQRRGAGGCVIDVSLQESSCVW